MRNSALQVATTYSQAVSEHLNQGIQKLRKRTSHSYAIGTWTDLPAELYKSDLAIVCLGRKVPRFFSVFCKLPQDKKRKTIR